MHGSITKESNEELLERCLEEAKFATPPNGGLDSGPSIEKRFRGKDPSDIYKMICNEQGVTSVYSVLNVENLMPETLRILLDNGLVYYDRGTHKYHTVVPLDG